MKNICDNCNAVLDAYDGLRGTHGPEEGSYNICAYCGHLTQFDKDLKLIPVTAEMLAALNDEDQELFDMVMKARNTVLRMKDFIKTIR
jgi:hypothetical protein